MWGINVTSVRCSTAVSTLSEASAQRRCCCCCWFQWPVWIITVFIVGLAIQHSWTQNHGVIILMERHCPAGLLSLKDNALVLIVTPVKEVNNSKAGTRWLHSGVTLGEKLSEKNFCGLHRSTRCSYQSGIVRSKINLNASSPVGKKQRDAAAQSGVHCIAVLDTFVCVCRASCWCVVILGI